MRGTPEFSHGLDPNRTLRPRPQPGLPVVPKVRTARDPSAIRFIALGRDATSIAHKEANEPTGVYVSNGGMQESGLLGTKNSLANPRGFFTQ